MTIGFDPPYTAANVYTGVTVDRLRDPRTQADYTAQKQWIAWSREQLVEGGDVLDLATVGATYDALVAHYGGLNERRAAQVQAINRTCKREVDALKEARFSGALDLDTFDERKRACQDRRERDLAALPAEINVRRAMDALKAEVRPAAARARDAAYGRILAELQRAQSATGE